VTSTSESPPDRYAVAGNPVAHSQSPFIHAAFAAQCGHALQYERLLCPLDAFLPTIQAFAASGAKGCNVTVPFKFEAFAASRRRSPRAELAGAVNTLRFDEQGWWGDNTDGLGLLRDIEGNAQFPLKGLRVLLLGAGGAAAGVLGSLMVAKPAELVVANRSVAKAEALVQSHQAWAQAQHVRLQACALETLPDGAFDVVVNGTSASLSGAGLPVQDHVLRKGGLGVDMMYGPSAQGFLDWTRQQGGQARDGVGMLVEQAAEAFQLWRGLRPDTGPVLHALRARLSTPG